MGKPRFGKVQLFAQIHTAKECGTAEIESQAAELANISNNENDKTNNNSGGGNGEELQGLALCLAILFFTTTS